LTTYRREALLNPKLMISRLFNAALTNDADVHQIESAHALSTKPTVQHVPIAHVRRSPFQPRFGIERNGDFDVLVSNIRVHGLIHPVAVRELLDGQFELLAGERRLLACEVLGEATIPAYVHLGVTDAAARAMTITENLARTDLYPLEEARAVAGLRDQRIEDGLAADVRALEGVAGRKKTTIAELLTISDMVTEVVLAQVTAQHGEAAAYAARRASKVDLLMATKVLDLPGRVLALVRRRSADSANADEGLCSALEQSNEKRAHTPAERAIFQVSWGKKKRLRVSTALPIHQMSAESASELLTALVPLLEVLKAIASSRAA